MPQALDVGRLIAGFVVLAGRHAVHQVVRIALGPVSRHTLVGQVGGDGLTPLGNCWTERRRPLTCQPRASIAGQTTADITTTHDQTEGLTSKTPIPKDQAIAF
jgi:hypothetical protein